MNQSQQRMIWIPACFIVSMVAVGYIGPTAEAQLDHRFPKHKLIDALVDRGMTELLEHLAKTDPPEDAAETRELVYRIHLSRWEDTSLDLNERRRELERAAEKIRALVKQYDQHESRPIWQTDLAGLLLFATLDEANIAGAFYELGVPTARQRTIFEQSVSEALVELSDAMQRMFVLQGELPKQKDHVPKRVNTGKWDRLMNRFYKLRTPFYLGHACIYVALLPDDHSFYKNLSRPHRKLPMRGDTPAKERRRVVHQGIEVLEDFVRSGHDPHGIYGASLSLTARLLLLTDQTDKAIKLLDKALATPELGPVTELTTRLARAKALHHKGQTEQALALVEALDTHALAKQDPVVRLLIVDLRHRMLLARAKQMPTPQQRLAVNTAYDTYDKLLNDKNLGEVAHGLRVHVYRRWAASIQRTQNLAELPSKMLRAVGWITTDEGEVLVGQALEQRGQKRSDGLRRTAMEKFKRAIQVYTELLGRDNISRNDRAEARFNQALAIHRTDETNDATTLKVVGLWKDLAEQMPEQQVCEQAITSAIRLLQPLFVTDPNDTHMRSLYLEVSKILFEKFPHIEVADKHRIHFAQSVLVPDHRFREAVKLLSQITERQDNLAYYYVAQADLLDCLQQAYEHAKSSAQAKLAAELRRQAQRVQTQSTDILKANKDPQLAKTIATALAGAQLSLSALLVAEDKMPAAIAQLKAIEHLKVPANLKIVARRDLISALARSGQLKEAQLEAKRLMDSAPGDAAVVIHALLGNIDRQSDQWRRKAALPQTTKAQKKSLLEKVHRSAESSVTSAEMLVHWARQQHEQDKLKTVQLDAFRIIEAKAKTVAGPVAQAIGILEQIKQNPDFAYDLALLDALGEAYYQAAVRHWSGSQPLGVDQRNSLIAAAGQYDTILSGMEPDDAGKYPDTWWNAWRRRLTINDVLNEGTQDIPLRVRQLRQTDPNLGGQPYKSELELLETKHHFKARS